MPSRYCFFSKDKINFFLIFIALFPITISPFRFPPIDNHYIGSEIGYDYWIKNGYRWGNEVIQNIGPLGFLHFPLSFTGILDFQNAIGNAVISSILIILIAFVYKNIRSRVLGFIFILFFVASCFLKGNNKFYSDEQMNSYNVSIFAAPTEVYHYLVILFTLYVFFNTKSYIFIGSLLLNFVFFSFGKGMFLYISSIIVFFTIIRFIILKRYDIASFIFIFFSMSVLITWIFIGQRLSDLPDFISGSVAFSTGYLEAMSNSKNLDDFIWISSLLLIILVMLSIRKVLINIVWKKNKFIFEYISIFILEILILFTIWKHAIIPADLYHFLLFLIFGVIVLIPYGFFQIVERPRYESETSAPSRLLTIRWEIIVLCVAIAFSNDFRKGYQYIFDINENVKMANEIKEGIFDKNLSMPIVNTLIEGGSIGYFGERPAPLMYNAFDYRPQPSTISFVGWERSIIEKDAAFFRNEDTAPEFLLFELQNVSKSVVEQFSPLSSPLAQLEIFHRYLPTRDPTGRPVEERGRLLLQRVPAGSPMKLTRIWEKTLRLGEWIDVPNVPVEAVQAVIEIPKSTGAYLSSILYKPPGYAIEYRLDDGKVESHRFSPMKSSSGFLVSPLIRNNEELIASSSADEWQRFLGKRGGSLRRITGFRISCEFLELVCASSANIVFNGVDGLRFGTFRKLGT